MNFNRNIIVILFSFALLLVAGCENKSSDTVQQQQQEKILAEATAQVGMPGIVNFRERRLMKTILELRDQEGLVTYTYLENLQPAVVPGKTALGGKLTYLGETIGYPLPYATQYTNPEKLERGYAGGPYLTLPQADPNGLFSPSAAEASWVLMKDPNGKETLPVYLEPRTVCLPFKLPID